MEPILDYGDENLYNELLKKEEISKSEIINCNGWKEVAKKIENDCHFGKWTNDEIFVYPGDNPTVKEFSDAETTKEDCKLQLDLPPCPFTPNILNAKLIILSLNPGYIKLLNRDLPGMLLPEYVGEYKTWTVNALRMEAKEKGGIYTNDVDKIIGENYWAKRLQPLAKKVKSPENIYNKVALLQYLGYTSTSYEDMPQIIPSQMFTKVLIRYITLNNTDAKFLILRARKKWEELIDGDTLSKLNKNCRLLYKQSSSPCQFLSENNLGKDVYDKIRKTLNLE